MDKTRKLGAVLSDDELFKQKALEYFTAADKSGSGTLSDEEVLEVRRAPNTVQSKAHLNHRCTRRRCTLIPTPCSPPPCQLCRKISERRSWFETQRSPRLPFGTAPSRPNWHHTEGPGRTFSPGSAAQERGCRAARLGAPLRPGFLDLN